MSNVDPTVPVFGNPTTTSVRQNFLYTKQELEALEAKRNNSGQIKANFGTSLQLVGFTANTRQTFDISSGTPSLSSASTTIFPAAAQTQTFDEMFDPIRGSNPTGRLIENKVLGQRHMWRIQGKYENKAQAQTGSLKIALRNPNTPFNYDKAVFLADGIQDDTFNVELWAIADEVSIPFPEGYVLDAITSFSDVDFTVMITSITRMSFAVEIGTPAYTEQ